MLNKIFKSSSHFGNCHSFYKNSTFNFARIDKAKLFQPLIYRGDRVVVYPPWGNEKKLSDLL